MRWALLVAGGAICLIVAAALASAQTTPGTPAVTVRASGTNALLVTWSAPTDNGGAAITSYDLRYIESEAADKADEHWTTELDVWSSGARSSVIRGLPDGTAYDVQMRAINADNAVGDWSTTSTGATEQHGSTNDMATELKLDDGVPGRISVVDEVDVFKIVLTEAADLWVYTRGDLETEGELFDVFGESVGSGRFGNLPPNGSAFSMLRRLPAGTYYLHIRSYESKRRGPYTVHAETVPPPGDSVATATSVSLDSVSPTWLAAGDEHLFKFELSGSTDVWLLSIGETNTAGELLDSNQNSLATNDDSALPHSTRGFSIREQLGAGTYYVKVTGSEATSAGAYTLAVRGVTDPGDSIATATPWGLRLAAAGRLDSAADEDFFEITLLATTYIVMMGVAPDHETYFRATVYDSQGNDLDMYEVPEEGWGGDFPAAAYAFWVRGRLAAGTYYLRVSSDSTDSGPYIVYSALPALEAELEEECNPGVQLAELQETTPNPLYPCQWHLNNTGLIPSSSSRPDINAPEAWETTRGAYTDPVTNTVTPIVVVVVDNELDHRHDDLKDNVLTQYNHSFFGDDVRNVQSNRHNHGTSVAGIIAASDNDVGGLGVAPEAKVFGHALIDDTASSANRRAVLFDNEVEAMSRNREVVAASNNSWGASLGGSLAFASAAFDLAIEQGLEEGFGGKGTVYVWAAGNSSETSHANADERLSHYGAVPVCAVNSLDGRASYSEMGANLWVCAPSYDPGLPGIWTTYLRNTYTDTFSGTSAAAPIVSGVIALIRAANPALTWRDVKLILAGSARQNFPTLHGWIDAGYRYGSTTERYQFHHGYGFGTVDAEAAVAMAKDWDPVPEWRESTASWSGLRRIQDARYSGSYITSGKFVITSLTLEKHVDFIEYVTIELDMSHGWFRDLRMELVSPSGSVGIVQIPRQLSFFGGGFIIFFSGGTQSVDGTFRLGSSAHLGEDAEGTWQLFIWDEEPGSVGVLRGVTITAHGHGYTPFPPTITATTGGDGSINVEWAPPDKVGGSAISSWDIRHIRSDAPDKSDTNWTVEEGADAAAQSYDIDGLDGGTNYDLQVRAVNDAGYGAWSTVVQEGTSAVAPSAPRNLSASIRDAALHLVWSPPEVGEVGVVRYEIRHILSTASAADKLDDTKWTVTDVGTVRGYTLGGLTNDHQYDLQVRIVNGIGTSAWSATTSATPEVLNANPAFPDTEPGERTVREHVWIGTDVGGPVEAVDPDDDTLVYSLAGVDADHFRLDTTSGQIETAGTLNYQVRRSYSVNVNVSDRLDTSGLPDTAVDDSIEVSIEVQNVNERPNLRTTVGSTPTVHENVDHPFAVIESGDPDHATGDRDPQTAEEIVDLIWELSGPDEALFCLRPNANADQCADPEEEEHKEFKAHPRVVARLAFVAPPDFEMPADAGADNVYNVRVTATDPGGLSDFIDFEITVTGLNEAPLFESPPNERSPVIKEHETGPVAEYEGTDLDAGSVLTYDVEDKDAGYFTMDPNTGVLTFKSPPDYEDPKDANRDNIYELVVVAFDPLNVGELQVAVTVAAVDEPPIVSGSTAVTVDENAIEVGKYTATDPEGETITWEALSGSDASHFTLDPNGNLRFITAVDYEARPLDNTYEVTVNASDGSEVGSLDVVITVNPIDEPPLVMGEQYVTIPENTAFVGNFQVSDPEGETPTATLAGSDASYFTLDSNGDLRFTNPVDYDARPHDNTYEVTVNASDGTSTTPGSLDVVVTVTDIDEPPEVTGPLTIDHPENSTTGSWIYTVTDPERRSLTVSLVGDDAGDFTFTNSSPGTSPHWVLAFDTTPDYEVKSAHQVTVQAYDGENTVTRDVTVSITNVDEPGTLTLSSEQPRISTLLTATLVEPDTRQNTMWTWSRSTNRSSWTVIAGATTESHIPTGDDRDHYLRALVKYTDAFGDKELDVTSGSQTGPDCVGGNTAPTVIVPTLSVREDARPLANVGSTVQATDAERDPLVYAIDDGPNLPFVISQTGQIRVASGATLDFETDPSYTIEVIVTDSCGVATTVSGVTLTVVDVDEPPVVSDDDAETDEDTPVTITVLSNDSDPEGEQLTVSLRRPPGVAQWRTPGHGAVETNGVTVTYTPNPDTFGIDSFSYAVSDGTKTSTALVTVDVDPINDPPAFTETMEERSISETAREGDEVGVPVVAVDVDDAPLSLTYVLTGAGSDDFVIEEHTGQITVATGVVLNVRRQRVYDLVVTVRDPQSTSNTVDLRITVTEGPVSRALSVFGGGGGSGGPAGPSPSAVDFEWTVKHDIDELDAGHDTVTGMWSDGTTLWLLENGDGADDAIYAYDLKTGERVEDREFELDKRNRAPRGIWAGETTMWVSDSGQDRLFAYDLVSGERLPDADVELADRNRDARGIWSDGQTMWVLDRRNALFAYDLGTGAFLAEYALDSANDDPRGIWSDPVTVWVSDPSASPRRLFAYHVPIPPPTLPEEPLELERVREEEFEELSSASNNSPRGIWSDGDVMYVADASDDKVYTYNMPNAIDARLASLSLSGIDIGEFDPGETEYKGMVAEGLVETTVTAKAVQRRTDIAINPPDADGDDANGHQVSLEGVGVVAVIVTSADGSRTKVYRVQLEPLEVVVVLEAGWNLLEWPGVEGASVVGVLEEAGLSDEVLAVYRWDEAADAWLGFFPGLEGIPGLNALTAFSTGQAYWIAVGEPQTWAIPRFTGNEY